MKKFVGGERSGNELRSRLVRVVWRNTAMTNTPGPMDALLAEVRCRSTGRQGRMAMARFVASGIDAGGARSPIDLVRLCNRPGSRGFAEQVVAGLVRLAVEDEMATLVALAALRPAFIRIVCRLVRRGIPRQEAQADVIAAAWESMRSLSAQPMSVAAARQVVAATWSVGRSDSRRVCRRRMSEEGLSSTFDVAERGSDPAERVSTLIFDAERHGILSRSQAVIVHDTRVLDRSVAEVAASLGRSCGAVRKRRERIEADLRDFVGQRNGEVAR
ncbi:MAG: hypothetical protein ACYCS7_07780 [Acidimicrobiales bacterium]